MNFETIDLGGQKLEFLGFEPHAVGELAQALQKIRIDNDPLALRVVENAILNPPQRIFRLDGIGVTGGVFTSDHAPVREALLERHGRVEIGGHYEPFFEGESHQLEKAIFGGIILGSYGHLLLETFTRSWHFNTEPDLPILFLTIRKAKDDHSLFFNLAKMLGIDCDRVHLVRHETHCRHLVVPEPGLRLGMTTNKRYIQFLKEQFSRTIPEEPTEKPLSRNVYLSRSGLPDKLRRPFGEEKLEIFFRENGFDVIHPEKLEIAHQARLFGGASKLAGYIGSQFHNMIFRSSNEHIDVIYFCDSAPNLNFLQLDMFWPGKRLYCLAALHDPFWRFGTKSPFQIDFDAVVEGFPFLMDGQPRNQNIQGFKNDDDQAFKESWLGGYFRKAFRKYVNDKTTPQEIKSEWLRDHCAKLLLRTNSDEPPPAFSAHLSGNCRYLWCL